MTGPSAIRILLIEDNELDARVMTKSLTAYPETRFEITRAEDLATATRLLAERNFDCMLLDLSLPDSSGLVSVEALAGQAPDCPIVVLTGLDDPSTALEAVQQGAQDYLSKRTTDSETVARSVRYAVARHHGDLALRSATDQLSLLRDRERIARDLHDTVIQQLFATGMSLQSVSAAVTDEDAQGRILQAVEGIDAAIRQLREAIFGLHAIPERIAIGQAITTLADEKAPTLGFDPIVEVGAVPDDIAPAVRHEVIQIVSEALSNVAKHAEATACLISVQLNQEPIVPELVVTVTDNGQGMAGARRGRLADERRGHGLVNMEQRAEELGGRFRLGPGAGGGTKIDWRVPLNGQESGLS